MSVNNSKDIFKQLEEVMLKCDNMSLKLKNVEKEHQKEIKKLKKDFAKERATLNAKIDSLEAEVKAKDKEIKKCHDEIDRLKSQINSDSTNSSLPPSTDIKPSKKDIANNRETSHRKVGGQTGHKGNGLSKSVVEKKIKNNEFKEHVIKDIGNPNNKYISKYILGISVNTNVTEVRFHADENGNYNIPKEFYTDVQYDTFLKSICNYLNIECSMPFNKIKSFLLNITNNTLDVSEGTLVNFIKNLSNKSQSIIDDIKKNILNASLLHTDATTSREEGKNSYIRNYSANNYTLLVPTKTKSKKDIEKTDILTRFVGTVVHDHETVIYNYGNKHAECNVHVTRYLKGNFKDTNNSWALDMKNFLNSLNNYRNSLISEGVLKLTDEQLLRFSSRYDEIISKGITQNKVTKNSYFKKEEKKLLNRLKKYKENHLLFLSDFSVPFSNNLSERDLRAVKIKQKVSGGFRSEEGQKNYCNIKSIYITLKKKKMYIFKITNDILKNIPVTI